MGADAIIVADAFMRDEGEVAAAGRVGNIGQVGTKIRGGGRQNLVEEIVRPGLAGRPNIAACCATSLPPQRTVSEGDACVRARNCRASLRADAMNCGSLAG